MELWIEYRYNQNFIYEVGNELTCLIISTFSDADFEINNWKSGNNRSRDIQWTRFSDTYNSYEHRSQS